MSTAATGSRRSAVPVLVLGAGAVYGAFRIVMAMTTSDTSALPVWGGVTVGVASQILGHSSNILQKRYGHLETTALQEAAMSVLGK